ncbi:hypothetical protein [Chania multitudinisentens]|uniref:hypothetical protein n=1 Tax=Chania multitudinisentens TaxID=1639108 RepID=UPI0003E1506B|nr:hypothetical protein [Chania multitudinisentens]
MPEIFVSALKIGGMKTIQQEIAAGFPQNNQNLVDYHPLLRLFAVQLLSAYLRGRFL